jgi:hypothetical protein
MKRWFGYKLHLVVDAEYELPVAFEVTRGSASNLTCGFGLMEKLHRDHPEIIDRCELMTGDRAYDSEGFVSRLWDDYGIKPVLDIRNLWRDGEETRLLSGRDNVAYGFRGNVFCYCPQTGERRQMAYGGFEKEPRDAEVPVSGQARVFTPAARSSHRWKRLYKKRTAVERAGARLDVPFGSERHYIHGLERMRLRCAVALCVMLAMALGRVKEKQRDLLRSLVRAA